MKILLFDIETSPCLFYTWSMWHEPGSTKFMVSDWYIMLWCAKWFDKRTVLHGSLFENPDYEKGSNDDRRISSELRALLDEADVCIAHNGNRFDKKKINTRMIVHGMRPPSPYKMIDTLLVARQQFGFTSNRLDDLGKSLGVGRKIKTGGFDLWRKCMDGDPASWHKMLQYCKRDVMLLEKVYKRLRPYIPNHPNISVYKGEPSCPACGSKNINKRGFAYTQASKFQRYVCMAKGCGKWFRDKSSEAIDSMRNI